MKALLALLLTALLATACSSPHGLHSSQLQLAGQNMLVVPSFVRNKDGRAFSGRAHGTFFGDSSFDCVEWEGQFVNGVPDGEFLIYGNCHAPPHKLLFKRGVRVTGPNNSFKPKPLRGSA